MKIMNDIAKVTSNYAAEKALEIHSPSDREGSKSPAFDCLPNQHQGPIGIMQIRSSSLTIYV